MTDATSTTKMTNPTRQPSTMLRRLILLLAAGASCASNEFGLKFLEENKPRDGVVTLASGLQYKVLKEGDGEAHPQKGTSCSCHYEGRTAQEWSMSPKGTTFDSSYARNEPTSFAPNQVIGGWTEAMQLMVEGDKSVATPRPPIRII
jgi:FKBP-type peptidyl-prolyl cis-trans isomerase FklB